MNRYVFASGVVGLLILGGCGGGGGGSSNVSVAGNASGVQSPVEGITAPTQTADQSPLPMPADLPLIADASDAGSKLPVIPTVRSIVPVTNSVDVAEDDAGGALSETPTPPPPKSPTPTPVSTQVDEDDSNDAATTGGTTNPKPPKAPKPPKTGTTGTGNHGGSTTGPTYGEVFVSDETSTTASGSTSGGVGAVPNPEPVSTSLVVLGMGSLAGYVTRRRR